MKLLQKITLVTTFVLGLNLAVPFFVMAQGAPYTFSFKFGSAGPGNGQFNTPFGIAIDTAGNIYVSDYSYPNDRVQKFDSSGNYITQFGTYGNGNGQFIYPTGITFDVAGNIYVVDQSRVQKFDSSGNYITQFGTYGTGNGQFQNPRAIALDAAGNIYVSDYLNNRVQKFDSSENYITQFGTSGSGNGQFALPFGIAIDTAGNIYVADYNNSRIQKFDSSENYITQFGTSGYPTGIALDSSGNIYVSNSSNHVQKFNSSGIYQSQFGTTGSGDGQFSNPLGIALDAAGNIYVSDTGNNRIQVFAPPAVVPPPPPPATSSIGQGEEVIQPGILQLTSVPANFNFPAVTISDFQTYNTIYLNQQTGAEKLTAEDKRFSGGFEVQMTATDYVGLNNSANIIPVSALGVLTQVPSAATSYTQTTNLINLFNASSGTLITGSQTPGTVLTQTIPFNFPIFGGSSNRIFICTSGFIIAGTAIQTLNASDFNTICADPGSPTHPTGNYGAMGPYVPWNTGQLLTTSNVAPFDSNNGVYYQNVNDNEVHIRYKGNIDQSGTNAGNVNVEAILYRDGRIEFHYGTILDNLNTHTPPTSNIIFLYNNNDSTLIQATAPPFDTFTTGTTVSGAKIRFTPNSLIQSDIKKPGTSDVFSPVNAASTTGVENYTFFTEDSGNPGFSVPVSTIEGGACLYHGRLGNYTLYPSFMLQILPTTAADTYQNTITFTIIDKTYPNGVNFCP